MLEKVYQIGYEAAKNGKIRAPIFHININALSENCVEICKLFLKGYDDRIEEELFELLK